jgi:hypothetical protein
MGVTGFAAAESSRSGRNRGNRCNSAMQLVSNIGNAEIMAFRPELHNRQWRSLTADGLLLANFHQADESS